MSNNPIKTEAEMFDLCQDVVHGRKNIGALISALIVDLRTTLDDDAGLLSPMKQRVAILLNTADLDELLIATLSGVADPQIRYNFATSFASIAIRTGEFDLAMRYQQLALTANRTYEHGESIAIGPDAQTSYDDNALHLDLAVKTVVAAAPDIARLRLRGKLRILDIGCGTGLSILPLLGLAEHIEGIDLDVSGVRRAGREIFFNALHEGDATEIIETLAGPFDLIISTGTVYHFAKLDWLFENAKKLLSPGGVLLFNNWPCPDSANTLLTLAGNRRHCHSERYLNEVAAMSGFPPCEKSWHVIYANHPNWFMRYTKPALPHSPYWIAPIDESPDQAKSLAPSSSRGRT